MDDLINIALELEEHRQWYQFCLDRLWKETDPYKMRYYSFSCGCMLESIEEKRKQLISFKSIQE